MTDNTQQERQIRFQTLLEQVGNLTDVMADAASSLNYVYEGLDLMVSEHLTEDYLGKLDPKRVFIIGRLDNGNYGVALPSNGADDDGEVVLELADNYDRTIEILESERFTERLKSHEAYQKYYGE